MNGSAARVRLSTYTGALLIGLLSCTGPSALAAADAKNELRERLDGLTKPGSGVAGVQIAARRILPRVYEALDYELAWLDPRSVKQLQVAVARSWEDGLLPVDFHDKVVATALTAQATRKAQVEHDIILSDAFVRLLYQLYFGKVSPNEIDPNWNFERPVLSSDPVAAIVEALKTGRVSAILDKVRLSHPFYVGLKATLQAHADYAAKGGWGTIPAGPLLKPGDKDARVAALRARLVVTGEYQGETAIASDVFDEHLAAALKRFQNAHGLEDDGVLGPDTLAALNVTPQQRIDQIRVNLERARWVLRGIGGDMVLVNIAGYYLHLVLKGERVWRTRVITGRTYHKTPVFTETMKTIVFNPDWSLPRSIVKNETFPRAVRDPTFLDALGYEIRDRNGRTVPASSVDWSRYSAGTFPFSVVQKPGPRNALGVVKFLFPNKYSVYLHDTPSRQLFDKAERTFSHGCIRVEDPLKLAELILHGQPGWNRTKVDAAVASGKMLGVKLTIPLPVLLLYWTVDPSFDGDARFYDDVYGRDARLLQALNAEFRPWPKGT